MGYELASRLRQRLLQFGLSRRAIDAAWPTWWSDEADSSSAARADLRFCLSRNLGLDPRSLLDRGRPRFLWHDVARFKHLAGESQAVKAAIGSFGAALTNILLTATPCTRRVRGVLAADFRTETMKHHPFPRLVDLLSVCWSFGIPVIHLRIFPLHQNRMSAMAVRVGSRSAILIGKESDYPPQIAFYIAHELAHIALGHLERTNMIVDLESETLGDSVADREEQEADQYALELLTGHREPRIRELAGHVTPRDLATSACELAPDLGIEPGTMALCFGQSTNQWNIANRAIPLIYSSRSPVWRRINSVAMDELSLERVSRDTRSYLQRVLGSAPNP